MAFMFTVLAAQPFYQEFLKLDEEKRVVVIQALAVTMAEALPTYFDKFIQDAVNAADLEEKKDLNGGPGALGVNPQRDFKRHLFNSITTTVMNDTVTSFDSRNCLMEKALAIRNRNFENVFNPQFVEKLAKGSKKVKQDVVWRYFGCAFFCMRIFNAAEYCAKNMKEYLATYPPYIPFYPAVHFGVITKEHDLKLIQGSVELLYNTMWREHDDLPEIESDALLKVYDRQKVTITFE